jgi:hypothetical protein
MLRNPTYVKRDVSYAEFTPFPNTFTPASLSYVSAGYFQRSLMDESGVTRTQLVTHNKSEMFAVYGTPWAIPPYNNTGNNTVAEQFNLAVIICSFRLVSWRFVNPSLLQERRGSGFSIFTSSCMLMSG